MQEAPTLFAKQSVIDAIEQDITEQDIASWAETANANFDLEYVVPIYSTINATKDSLAILETLEFDNQYMIPIMSNGKCIGTTTVGQHEHRWVIAVYEPGSDLKTEVDKNKDTATCLIDVVQLNNVILPKTEYAKRDIWTADMIRLALDKCTDSKLYVAMNLSFACSLRMGEILGLT